VEASTRYSVAPVDLTCFRLDGTPLGDDVPLETLKEPFKVLIKEASGATKEW
jgi:hypothetical protein